MTLFSPALSPPSLSVSLSQSFTISLFSFSLSPRPAVTSEDGEGGGGEGDQVLFTNNEVFLNCGKIFSAILSCLTKVSSGIVGVVNNWAWLRFVGERVGGTG